jgi:TolB-like protein
MKLSLRSRLIAAALTLSAALSAPAHSQKLLSDGIKDLATQIATNVSKEKKQKVAILPFRELDGKNTILGSYISEELVTDLFGIGGLDIVERAMLDRLLGEIKLGQTGVLDPETARKVGKVAGVDAIVTGSITDLQSYVSLNCRLIDAQTGRVFGAAQTRIVKDDDVRKIMGTALTEGGGDRTPAPRSEASETGPKGMQQQWGDITFELKQCSLSGALAVCELLITNKGEDHHLHLSAPDIRMIDEGGSEYHARAVSIGGQRNDLGASTTITSGVPVRARLTFEGVSPEARRAALIELKGGNRNGFSPGGSIQFRNVPLTRP